MKQLIEYIKETIETDIADIRYIAIVLNETSSKELQEFCKEQISTITNFEPRYICHHMTVAFGKDITNDIYKWANVNEGAEIEMTATRLGISDKAIAVEVETKAPCANIRKHVTLATNIITNGKPVQFNDIKEWKPLDNKISLRGIVTKILK